MIIFRVTQVCCWACFWCPWWYWSLWLRWCQVSVCVSVAAWVTEGSTPWSPLCLEGGLEEPWGSCMCSDRWAAYANVNYIAYTVCGQFTVSNFGVNRVSCWQCVAGAMYITGFAESIAQVLSLQSMWAVRGISVAVLLGLLGINLAGVKWIIRLQLVLLGILAMSTLDFVIGTFSHLDPGELSWMPMILGLICNERNQEYWV